MTQDIRFEDWLAINQIVSRYANAVDALDYETLADLLTDDMVLDVGVAPDMPARGAHAVIESLRIRREDNRRAGDLTRRHMVSNLVIKEVVANVIRSTCAVAIVITSPTGMRLGLSGIWEDVFRQVDGQWRLAARRFVRDAAVPAVHPDTGN